MTKRRQSCLHRKAPCSWLRPQNGSPLWSPVRDPVFTAGCWSVNNLRSLHFNQLILCLEEINAFFSSYSPSSHPAFPKIPLWLSLTKLHFNKILMPFIRQEATLWKPFNNKMTLLYSSPRLASGVSLPWMNVLRIP